MASGSSEAAWSTDRIDGEVFHSFSPPALHLRATCCLVSSCCVNMFDECVRGCTCICMRTERCQPATSLWQPWCLCDRAVFRGCALGHHKFCRHHWPKFKCVTVSRVRLCNHQVEWLLMVRAPQTARAAGIRVGHSTCLLQHLAAASCWPC